MSAATISSVREITHPSGMPLIESIDQDRKMTLVAQPQFSDAFLEHEPDFSWLSAAKPKSIAFDLTCFPFVNSVVLGWLLRLTQAAVGTPVSVRGNRRVVTQLRLLHLDRLVATVVSEKPAIA